MEYNYSNFSSTTLEDTGVFNYHGNQSSVYNRLKDNGIDTLQQLFNADDNNAIQFGKDKSNDNFFIHTEVSGIINLLRYKYLNEDLPLYDLLTTDISVKHLFISYNSHRYGYPGSLFHNVIYYDSVNEPRYLEMMNLYKILKYCGFDQTGCKVILDDIVTKKVKSINLGQYFKQIDYNFISKYFVKTPNEFPVFINVLTTLVSYYDSKFTQKKK